MLNEYLSLFFNGVCIQFGIRGTPRPYKYIGISVTDKYIGVSVTDRYTGISVTDKYIGISVTDKYIGISVTDRYIGISVTDKYIGISVTDKYMCVNNGGNVCDYWDYKDKSVNLHIKSVIN